MMRDILCKIGIHSWVYSKKNLPYGGLRQFRRCSCCLLSQKRVNTSYEFSVNSRTGEINQPKAKWKWKDSEMSKEDLRELRLRKLGI